MNKKSLNGAGYKLLAPSLIGVLIFAVLPFAFMLINSFFSNQTFDSFVGLDNYNNIFSSRSFKIALGNTLVFLLMSIPTIVLASIAIADKICKSNMFTRYFKGVFLLPLVIPSISVIVFFDFMFDYDGFMNVIIQSLNIDPINWIDSNFGKIVVLVIYLWKNIGYLIIIFVASINAIPVELYEAARIDGASKLREFTTITLVYSTPTIFYAVVISIVNTFKTFKEIFLMYGNYPPEKVYMIQNYLNNLFMRLDYNRMVSSSVVICLILTVIILVLFWLQEIFIERIN